MARNTPHRLLPRFTIFLALMAASASSSTFSCDSTPYPELCREAQSDPALKNEGLKFQVVQAAIDRAVRAHSEASAAGASLLGEAAEAAWADCLELCEDTIRKLNRSILSITTSSSSSSSNFEDSQTWLSAAIANQQTCRNGFVELGVATHLASTPFMADNLTECISNSLAVNKASLAESPLAGGNRRLLSDVQLFPKWVSAADRRLLQSNSNVKADLVVAQDGSGDYTTISAALTASLKLRSGTSRYVIHVKAGTYSENVKVTASMQNIMMVGDGIGATVVTGSKNVDDGSTTFQSATFAISGDGFIAQGITFRNTAGAAKHQAVALRSGSDLSVFYECSIEGYQDTLYVYSQRQFYRNCNIYGTVDFIFGDAVSVFQNCNLYVRKPLSGQENTVTAQGRTDPNENTGIVVQNSVVAAASDLAAAQGSFKSYLGRPWQEYSRTIFMETQLGSLIDPTGWLEWDGDFALSTLYYGEYLNTGAGAATGGRVTWPGFHVITSASVASEFTVGNFLSGSSWIPATGVPYTLGL